jgi:hypothetical protein
MQIHYNKIRSNTYMDEQGVDYGKKLDGEIANEGEISGRGNLWTNLGVPALQPPPRFHPWASPAPRLLRRVAACASPKRRGK